MDSGFADHMLYVRNEDKPGFIGELGRILGENKVNIATMSLGRMDDGTPEAVCLVSVDSPVDDAVANALRAVDQVKRVNVIAI